jgi:lycopene beta-cyclase
VAAADVVVAGGGLAGALVALAYAERQPGLRVLVVEPDAVGGNHLWSMHEDDVPAAMRSLVEPLIVARWPSYRVAFPGLAREVRLGYASISSARLAARVAERLPGRVRRAHVRALDPGGVVLDDGSRVDAALVVDARGVAVDESPAAGFQKFVGLELELAVPCALPATVMDATVVQADGLRFVYTLPLSTTRVLVEDTVVSDTPHLDRALLETRVLAHARALGLEIAGVARAEHGVLPLALAGPDPRVPEVGPLVVGTRGGWCHPTTGYALPLAVRLAWTLAGLAPAQALAAGSPLRALAAELAPQLAFARLLNRLLFRATGPDERWRVLERFHRLPDATIARFYALATTRGDRLRVLCGRPPRGVSLRRALAELRAPEVCS